MKSVFSYASVLGILFFSGAVFAYDQTDLLMAQSLADEGIIVDRSGEPDRYRLDDLVSRAEVVGVVLKMADIPLPEDYKCQGYFSDVTKDDWICRAVEIASGYEIVTRQRSTFYPQRNISRSEALAMAMKLSNIEIVKNVPRTGYSSDYTQWQVDLVSAAVNNKIISSAQDFGPNEPAKRSEVFGWIVSISLHSVNNSDASTTEPQMVADSPFDTDNREWELYSDADTGVPGFLQEHYLLVSDDPENWQELVTYSILLSTEVTVQDYFKAFSSELQKQDANIKIQLKQEKNDYVIAEYNSAINNEKGIFKIMKGTDGVYVLMYSAITPVKDATYFTLWQGIISNTKLQAVSGV